MRVSRSRIMLRRAAALVVAIAATAAIALLVFRAAGGGHGGEVRIPSGVSAASRKVVKRMSLAEKVDQVLALGFAGTDSTAPVLEKLRHRQIGGIFVGSQDSADACPGERRI